jgi:hypothetical protein
MSSDFNPGDLFIIDGSYILLQPGLTNTGQGLVSIPQDQHFLILEKKTLNGVFNDTYHCLWVEARQKFWVSDREIICQCRLVAKLDE